MALLTGCVATFWNIASTSSFEQVSDEMLRCEFAEVDIDRGKSQEGHVFEEPPD